MHVDILIYHHVIISYYIFGIRCADVNEGYQNVNSWVVDTVNGEKIWNLNDFVAKVEAIQDDYIILENK